MNLQKSISSLRGNKGKVTTESASHTSLSSLRETINRAIRGTPPPPYEVRISTPGHACTWWWSSVYANFQVVTSKTPPKPAATKKEVDENSCSSLVDLLHLKSSTEQSQRSTPSSSRRSSDGRTTTNPVSPDIRKRTASTTASDILMTRPGLPIPHKPLVSSQSQQQICRRAPGSWSRGQGLRKSHSSVVGFHQSEYLIQFSRDSLAHASASNENSQKSKTLEKQNSELSDEVSSMSSTSLSISNTKIVWEFFFLNTSFENSL